MSFYNTSKRISHFQFDMQNPRYHSHISHYRIVEYTAKKGGA